MQRTRCLYFYDDAARCNKRTPGAGCDAIGGFNRMNAILGASDCLRGDASVGYVRGAGGARCDRSSWKALPAGRRTLKLTELHRLPGATPHIETQLDAGELITAVEIPACSFAAQFHVPQDSGSRELRVRAGLGRGGARMLARTAKCATCARRWAAWLTSRGARFGRSRSLRGADVERGCLLRSSRRRNSQDAHGLPRQRLQDRARPSAPSWQPCRNWLKHARPRSRMGGTDHDHTAAIDFTSLRRRAPQRGEDSRQALHRAACAERGFRAGCRPAAAASGWRGQGTGVSARFAAEVAMENLAYAALCYSTITRGRIRSFDLWAAQAAARRRCSIMTHDNAPRLKPPPLFPKGAAGSTLPVMQDASDSLEWRACRGGALRIRRNRPIKRPRSFASPMKRKPRRWRSITNRRSRRRTSWASRRVITIGDAREGTRRRAGAGRSRCIATPRHHHGAIELHAVTVAWEGDELLVHDSTQMVQPDADDVCCTVFGLPMEIDARALAIRWRWLRWQVRVEPSHSRGCGFARSRAGPSGCSFRAKVCSAKRVDARRRVSAWRWVREPMGRSLP